ncbi:hypothetical protein FRX31_003250 [Thalictrum thalictroides]|uniref:F-box domain-containing protein n=1 Tax=Thalictrum thalictroides TaxID=46969 RepID=A0A7J6XE60_THATH|nr:hypothetical protein FRX31_003250 [Thalictrum thalictroides]
MSIRKSPLSNQDPWKKLDDVLVEIILARLPVADIFRSQFVCRRWESVIRFPAFQKACQELFSRLPWFFMLNFQYPSKVVYDMEVDSWCHISLSIPTDHGVPSTPLATSNSLMCCFSGNGSFFVCNPLNGSVRYIDVIISIVHFKAIAMHALGSSYHVFCSLLDERQSSHAHLLISAKWLDYMSFKSVQIGPKSWPGQ